MVPSDNAVSNGHGYYITQQQVQLERAREVEQQLMTELQQLTREKEQVTREKELVTRDKEQVCSLYNLLASMCFENYNGFLHECWHSFLVSTILCDCIERAATDETSPGIVHY